MSFCNHKREFIVNLISKALEIDKDTVADGLVLSNDRINTTTKTKLSRADAMYKNNSSYIDIEVNLENRKSNTKKNARYICHLVLKQTKPNNKDIYRPVYQINIDHFDRFKKNKFIYRSSIREETSNTLRDDSIKIVDLNLDYIRSLDYNKVNEKEDDSLEKMLYFFICKDIEQLDKLYGGNKIMENVNEQLKDLNEDFDNLYYDYDAYRKELAEEVSIEIGEEKARKEIAKNLLDMNMSIEDIMKATKLTQEEIESLK